MIRFISYNSYGCAAWSIGIKGLDILLNIFLVLLLMGHGH